MTQKEALDILKTGANVYLTGSAGSGKTYVLDMYIQYLKRNKIRAGITASTGVAATHLNGMTINSWVGLGIKKKLSEADVLDLLKRKYLHNRFKGVQSIIIDEVSMLPSYTLEAIDQVMKAFKRNDLPFGGLQVILCGDFFQLPPVEKDPESTNHFIYKSTLWKELDLKVCYLDKPYRQDDKKFLHLLKEIRENNVRRETWDLLKERFMQKMQDGVVPTKLYTHNSHADIVNDKELAKIHDETHIYKMNAVGNESLAAIIKKSCLAPEMLILKRGALVMFVKNNFDAGYVNGTLGKVINFDMENGCPIVETFSGKKIPVYDAEWVIEDDGDKKARITQLPLRLAWAITIHKSQGMSLDAAEIDLGKSFVEGLGYVALSRVRSLDGIKLRSINRTALSVNDEVIEFDKKLQQMSEETVKELRGSYWYKKNKN